MIEKIYIGSYADNIKICEFNNGYLKIVKQSGDIVNPSYLHINKDRLYCVCETDLGFISSFKIESDCLKQIDIKQINESLPCYITTDKQRNRLLVANYGSGAILMYKVKEDGSIGEESCRKVYDKNSNMHYAQFINNQIYAVDLGNDAIYIYDYEMNKVEQINVTKGSGPRHITVSQDNKTIYVVTELSNQIFVYNKNEDKFKLIQTISTLTNKACESYAGAIKISKDNRNIYVTNRGDNSISVFEIRSGKLELIQNISSYGDFPRDIILNDREEYMLVANQKSNNIAIFKRNINNGRLSRIEDADLTVDSPSCLVRSAYGI